MATGILLFETLEERNSVERLLNHTQYDGNGFRLGPAQGNGHQHGPGLTGLPGPGMTGIGGPPAIMQSLDRHSLQLNKHNDKTQLAINSMRGDSYFADGKTSCVRFDSGFREYEQEQEQPHLEKAIHAVKFVAQHVKNLDRYDKVADDWKYVAMVLDRILLWVFSIACVAGTGGIIFVAPSLYDTREPLDILISKVGSKNTILPPPRSLVASNSSF